MFPCGDVLFVKFAKDQTNLSAVLDCSRRGSNCVDSLLLSWVVKAYKSVTAHEGHYCAMIHDQRRDVAFGGQLST